jgi:hypothetical protein
MLHPDFNVLGEPFLTRSAMVNKLSRNPAHGGCCGLCPKVSVTQRVRGGAVRKTPSLSAMSGFRDFRSRLMSDPHCCYCQQVFQLSRYHPHQLVCSRPDCQRQRRREYHRRKLHIDTEYHQVCRDSQQKWRASHPDYPRRYRQSHPESVERNRQGQRRRDRKRHLQNLVKNNLAFDLKHSAAEIWLLGPEAANLAKNNLAFSQVLILPTVPHGSAAAPAS